MKNREWTPMDANEETLELLATFESRNVTFIDPDGTWPIVWDRARGVHVWDTNGRKYLDLTAGFGVAAAGHANSSVVGAGQRQMAKLLHAMGDVHPHSLKARLARDLSRITFERWSDRKNETGKTIFCNSGFEAVEAALKTAMLANGKRDIIAFRGGYHGLGYGALNATHRSHFRGPFESQLGRFGSFVEYPVRDKDVEISHSQIEKIARRKKVGAILVEPIQARGGIVVPSSKFLPMLARLSRKIGALLILDEIYTGFGRTGDWFACEAGIVIPDIICLGKALTGGFPLSACVGRADVMDRAWPPSTGEAIHTSTFLGHPVGCAMALANIAEIRKRNLPSSAKKLGSLLTNSLTALAPPHNLRMHISGRGLMIGATLTDPNGKPATSAALWIVKRMLQKGFIVLPEGEHSNVISFTPPLIITASQLLAAVKAFAEALEEWSNSHSGCSAAVPGCEFQRRPAVVPRWKDPR